MSGAGPPLESRDPRPLSASMKPYDLPELGVTPARPHWRRALVGAVVLMALGALAARLLTGVSWGRDDTAAARELTAAQLHSVSLASSIASNPPVSVAQIDDLLQPTRAILNRLRDEEARAWVMRDVLDLDSARQAWQLAESKESLASLPVVQDAMTVALITTFRYEAAEHRRRAAGMLWRLRQLAPPQLPRSVAPPAVPASAAPAPAPARPASR